MSIKVKFIKDFEKGYASENVTYKTGDEADLAIWQVELLLAEEYIEVLKIEPEDEALIEHANVGDVDGVVVLPVVEASSEVDDPTAPKHKRKKAK